VVDGEKPAANAHIALYFLIRFYCLCGEQTSKYKPQPTADEQLLRFRSYYSLCGRGCCEPVV